MWVQLPLLQPVMLRVAQMVRAPGCCPGGRQFETGHAPHGFLAQLVERQTEDLRVPGSIPGEPTKRVLDEHILLLRRLRSKGFDLIQEEMSS